MSAGGMAGSAESRREAADPDDAGIGGMRPVGQQVAPDRRAHTIRADEQITLGGAAVGEGDGNGVAVLCYAADALLVVDGDLLPAQLLGKEAKEQGARHTHRRLTVALRVSIGQTPQRLAALVHKDALTGDRRVRGQGFCEAKFRQDVHAVGRKIQATADPFGVGIGLIDRARYACLLEEEGQGRAAHATAGDQDTGIASHAEPPILPILRATSALRPIEMCYNEPSISITDNAR